FVQALLKIPRLLAVIPSGTGALNPGRGRQRPIRPITNKDPRTWSRSRGQSSVRTQRNARDAIGVSMIGTRWPPRCRMRADEPCDNAGQPHRPDEPRQYLL